MPPHQRAARAIAASTDHPFATAAQEPPMGIIGLLIAVILLVILLRLIA